MNEPYVTAAPLSNFDLWERANQKRIPFSFELEVTARCNNDCRHCYINLPTGDQAAKAKEMSLEEIEDYAGQAVKLGAIWCLITGGEPLLRRDFPEIYLGLKRKGLLVSVFTNACLVTEEHIQLFKKYPPRDIEVSVYGVSQATYEGVTRKHGSYAAFRRGLDLLLRNGIKVRLKAMALHSNLAEFAAISTFCRELTKDYFRFDPLLHLRYDGNPTRNAEIVAERLTPEEIVQLEQADPQRSQSLRENCGDFILTHQGEAGCDHLFHCGIGVSSFCIGYDASYRLCSALTRPDCTFDLRKGSLEEAWFTFTPKIRDLRSGNQDFLDHCHQCPLVNLCLWCPANACLESGQLDGRSEYFCQVAHARAAAIQAALLED